MSCIQDRRGWPTGPCAGNNHVALETKDGFADLVPDGERDAGVVLGFAGRSAGQEIFVVDEETPVAEDRSRELQVEWSGHCMETCFAGSWSVQ
jgi:hypothetical protein